MFNRKYSFNYYPSNVCVYQKRYQHYNPVDGFKMIYLVIFACCCLFCMEPRDCDIIYFVFTLSKQIPFFLATHFCSA